MFVVVVVVSMKYSIFALIQYVERLSFYWWLYHKKLKYDSNSWSFK